MKKNVRRCRRDYQHARQNGRNVKRMRKNVYKNVLREYKRIVRHVKEGNWRQFVRERGGQDPWGDVYRVCMGKKDRCKLSGMQVDERMTSTWRESVDVLMDRFFPAAGMNNDQIAVRRVLYSACVMYGAIAGYDSMQFAYARELLNRCQRVVLYACLNVCHIVFTEAMQVLLGGLLWDLECVRRGLAYRIRHGLEVRVRDVIDANDLRNLTEGECLQVLNKRVHDVWQRQWSARLKGRVTYKWIQNVRFAVNVNDFKPSLRFGYLLTGHGSMNKYLFKRSLSMNESCVCGNACED